jgi:hypothetical protein
VLPQTLKPRPHDERRRRSAGKHHRSPRATADVHVTSTSTVARPVPRSTLLADECSASPATHPLRRAAGSVVNRRNGVPTLKGALCPSRGWC